MIRKRKRKRGRISQLCGCLTRALRFLNSRVADVFLGRKTYATSLARSPN